MTLDELAIWLAQNPEKWEQQPRFCTRALSELPLSPPDFYIQFLERFGPICWFNGHCFLDVDSMIEVTSFIRGLDLTETPENLELLPFLSLGYDNCYLCFSGETIFDFSPYDLAKPIAESIEDFLNRFIAVDGEAFWL